jgi:hypothetical protein
MSLKSKPKVDSVFNLLFSQATANSFFLANQDLRDENTSSWEGSIVSANNCIASFSSSRALQITLGINPNGNLEKAPLSRSIVLIKHH